MPLSDLRKKIENRYAKLAVIGLGYVGLPLAVEFGKKMKGYFTNEALLI